MSLVEKALQKLHDARTAPSGEDVVVGSIVSTGVHPRPDFPVPANSGYRTDRMIAINRAALRTAGLLPPEDQERRVAHEYRRIKRPLIAAAIGKGTTRLPQGHLIMVASALPGEGKTFTSINLALSMALEKDISVVLVDADVAKPHISRTFGVSKEPGLLDVLRNESMHIESVVIPTDIPRLSILPAGPQIETATELLASRRMRQLVTMLGSRDENRIVLLDSPPLLLTSESRALAGVVGQIVIVVREGFTLQQAVIDALESLGSDLEGKSVGFILNQSEATPPGAYYGYGDYYANTGQQP